MTTKRKVAIGLMVAGIVLAIGSGYKGLEYYLLPLSEKFKHPLHKVLEPAGLWGHAFGFIGTFIILLNYLYSLRRRYEFDERLGSLRYWMEFHMFVGFVGPILIIYHSTLKFEGWVATICFFSMATVVITGIIGRYIYTKIPHRLNGIEMTIEELKEVDSQIASQLGNYFNDPEMIVSNCQLPAEKENFQDKGMFRLIGMMIRCDLLSIPQRKKIMKYIMELPINKKEKQILKTAVKKKMTLVRQMAVYDTLHKLLHNWRFFHKKVAWVFFITLVVHVTLTFIFGFKWIF